MKKIMIIITALIIAVNFTINTAKSQVVNVTANTGSGTTNFVAKWIAGTPTFRLGDSQIQESSSKIGIGISPTFKLDVNGDINIPGANAFFLGGVPFLFNNTITSCLFVGYSTGSSGFDNTFIGSYAGNSNQGFRNTYVGSNAGMSGTVGTNYQNTAVGFNALQLNYAYGSCAVGYNAAGANESGCSLTAMGEDALAANYDGDDNCAFGHDAGATIVSGSNNTFIGNTADAGGTSGPDLNNATAIGAFAVTMNSNEMVLGNLDVYVGIGYSGVADFPPGKLSVDENAGDMFTPTIAGFFHNGDVTPDVVSIEKRAVVGICDGYSTYSEGGTINIGGDFSAQESEFLNIGVRGRTGIYEPQVTFGEYAFGGYFEAKNSTYQNIGVFGFTDAKGSNINYGVYGKTDANSCGSGGCVSAAAFFDGDVYCTTNNYFPSDATFKDNIQPLVNNINIIKSLSPKSFIFKNSQFPNINLPKGSQSGLIAQDVQNVLPNLIGHFKVPGKIDSLGVLDTTGTGATYLAVNYTGLIPYLIGAIREQQGNIDSLVILIDTLRKNDSLMSARMDNLEQLINNCCSAGSSSGRMRNNIDVELSSENTIILNQNDPNPFAEQTRITYNVTNDVKEAKIIFFDNKGHVLQTVTINERGAGQINVYGEKLSSGIYSYSLIADGKVIDTKKMVCSK